jgi:hypothetical protein
MTTETKPAGELTEAEITHRMFRGEMPREYREMDAVFTEDELLAIAKNQEAGGWRWTALATRAQVRLARAIQDREHTR